jgi:uncharacterized protein (DUF1778 family)
VDKTEANIAAYDNPVLPQLQVPEATCSIRLSERDAAEVMAAAETPPAPNEAALQAARRFLEHHG